MITSAPQLAAAKAISRPRPRLPPVTRTTRSVRSNSSSAYATSAPCLGAFTSRLAYDAVDEPQLVYHRRRNDERIQRILAHRRVHAIEEQRQPLPVEQQS